MAIDHYIETVQQNEQLTPIQKAAYTWNAKKVIKQAANASAVCDLALSEGLDMRKLNAVDEDWLDDFIEKASNVSHEEILILWAKILLQETEEPESVPRALLHVLSIMGRKKAEAFMKLASYCVTIHNADGTTQHRPLVSSPSLRSYSITPDSLSALSAIGLLQYGTYISENLETGDIVEYFGKTISADDLEKKEGISTGDIVLSHTGEALMKIVSPEEADGFYEKMVEPLFHNRETKWE